MIIVTGTKRSGTSAVMQVLEAAGYSVIGSQFPRNWRSTLRSANPGGFYESILRDGIHKGTNPNPETGTYLRPEEVRRHAVKVFVPGLLQTNPKFIDFIIGCVRRWQEVEASAWRLYMLEDEARTLEDPNYTPPLRLPPAYRWWIDNYALLRLLPKYRNKMGLMAYDRLVQDPTDTTRRLISFLGDGDWDAAQRAVHAEYRTQQQTQSDTVEPEIAAVFDELYDLVYRRKFRLNYLNTLKATNEKLTPKIQELLIQIKLDQQYRQQASHQ